MNISPITEAARNLARYLEANGEESDLSVIEAQLELMKQRLRLVRLARHKKTLELVKG